MLSVLQGLLTVGNFLRQRFLLFFVTLEHFRKTLIGEYACCVLLKHLFNQPVDFGDSPCTLFHRLLKLFVFFLTHSVGFLRQHIQKYRFVALHEIR